MRWNCVIVLMVVGASAFAQTDQHETLLHADFRHEREHIKEACGTFGVKALGGCAAELVTDHPLHIALGSIAPQNGFGFGAAFVAHKTPNERWRLSWDFDAVGASSGAWRAGGYMKIIHTPTVKFKVIHPGEEDAGNQNKGKKPKIHPYTVFNIYAQNASLPKLLFYGLGPSSLQTGRTFFGMQQAIVGANVVKPVTKWSLFEKLNVSLLGDVNGRFVNIQGNRTQSSPSIEQLYSESTAPGLSRQPGFVQLGEGVRIKPTTDHFHLNYLVNFQQFFAPSDSRYSFRRWTLDLGHEYLIYGKSQLIRPKDAKELDPKTKETDKCTLKVDHDCPSVTESARPNPINGPDECASAPDEKCPSISYSRNREGTIAFRFLMSESIASAGSTVPFYFQPTLGGSDINGNPALSSYADYRFRGPNLLLLRESFEHSLWGPLGFTFMADQGKVALTRGDADFQNLKHSFATGITLRAGGFPQVFLLYSWGGNEGQHTIASVNTSLLGGSSRPSLY
jgi:hypothetical protein